VTFRSIDAVMARCRLSAISNLYRFLVGIECQLFSWGSIGRLNLWAIDCFCLLISILEFFVLRLTYLLIHPSVLWNCWLGYRKGIWPVKILGMLVWWCDESFAHLIAPVVTSPPSSLAPIKSRMETFWYRLTQVVLENGH